MAAPFGRHDLRRRNSSYSQIPNLAISFRDGYISVSNDVTFAVAKPPYSDKPSYKGCQKTFIRYIPGLNYSHFDFYKIFSTSDLSVRNFAVHRQVVQQVYYFENTNQQHLSFSGPYQIVHDIKQFGIRTVKGGFKRRPELIKERLPDLAPQSISGGTKTYGLFDKCERIQQELTEKVLELMNLGAAGQWMLDVGCGHGWSLTIPTWKGFHVMGVDLDLQALSVVQHKTNSKYLTSEQVYVVRADMTNGLCFRENTFDCAISISFLQWLCTHKHSKKTLNRFFTSLSSVLKPGGKAGIQFYPRNVNDVDRVLVQAQKYFTGALVADFPHINRGRKLFLVLENNK